MVERERDLAGQRRQKRLLENQSADAQARDRVIHDGGGRAEQDIIPDPVFPAVEEQAGQGAQQAVGSGCYPRPDAFFINIMNFSLKSE